MYKFQTNRRKKMEKGIFNQPNRKQKWEQRKKQKESIVNRKYKVRI
jgi:hypothetical protein